MKKIESHLKAFLLPAGKAVCIATLLTLTLHLSGCADPAKLFSDVAESDSEEKIKRSLATELSSESMYEECLSWFHRHRVPIISDKVTNGAHILIGGFKPYYVQVPGVVSADVFVVIEFGSDGRVLSKKVETAPFNL